MTKWQEVKISLNRAAEEGAYAVLDKRGIENYVVGDTNLIDHAQEFGWGDYFPEQDSSALITITCYFSEPISANELTELKDELLHLKEFGFNPEPVIVLEGQVSEEDWADAWKTYYHPLKIGRVYIQPSWTERPKVDSESEIVINLDPGMAFGAGTHQTTSMCIEFLQTLDLTNKKLWDVGTGSGILAIVAAKLGATVQAVDIDPVAVRVAKENRDLNQVRFDVKKGSLEDLSGTPEIIVANIIADIIGPMFPRVYTTLAPGGFFVAGGIIEDRDEEIVSLGRAAGLILFRRMQKGEWVNYLWQRGE